MKRLLCEQLPAELKVPCMVDNKGGGVRALAISTAERGPAPS
ncbi:hypothetical protein [Reyranella sp.]